MPKRPPEQDARAMMHFYCQKQLWALFELIAEKTECPIDELIAEAMRDYAKKHSSVTDAESTTQVITRQPSPPGTAAAKRGTPEPPRASPQTPIPQVLRGKSFGESVAQWTGKIATNSGVSTSGSSETNKALAAVLELHVAGRTAAVDKDQFVVGRASKYSDFVIKDSNVSRRHLAIVRRGGVWYIQDLGSTNGVEFKGMRIDNKRIDEGDVFRICEHELHFTYKNP